MAKLLPHPVRRTDAPLVRACWWMCLGFALNAGYAALHYGFGFGPLYFLPGPEDRFADLVKVALSFRDFTADITGQEEFQAWPALYKDYMLRNPYGAVDALQHGHLTHFHHPPLSQISFTFCAILIATTKAPGLTLWVWFGIYSACVAWLAATYMKCAPDTESRMLPLLILCFVSFPALCVFSRGNYHAGFASVLIAVFLVSCYGQRAVSRPALLALALAINFRPVAGIFLLAIPLLLGPQRAVRPLLFALTMVGTIFGASLAIENAIYPTYNVHSFLQGLVIYKNLYIIGPMGDGGNASLWALIKNSVTMLDTTAFYHDELYRIFVALSMFAVVLACSALRGGASESITAPFALVALYILLSPICAEYHLLVCVAPLLVSSLNPNADPRRAKIVFVAIVVLLIPKNYIFVAGLSLQTLLNPLALLVALLLLHLLAESDSRSGIGAAAA